MHNNVQFEEESRFTKDMAGINNEKIPFPNRILISYGLAKDKRSSDIILAVASLIALVVSATAAFFYSVQLSNPEIGTHPEPRPRMQLQQKVKSK